MENTKKSVAGVVAVWLLSNGEIVKANNDSGAKTVAFSLPAIVRNKDCLTDLFGLRNGWLSGKHLKH